MGHGAPKGPDSLCQTTRESAGQRWTICGLGRRIHDVQDIQDLLPPPFWGFPRRQTASTVTHPSPPPPGKGLGAQCKAALRSRGRRTPSRGAGWRVGVGPCAVLSVQRRKGRNATPEKALQGGSSSALGGPPQGGPNQPSYRGLLSSFLQTRVVAANLLGSSTPCFSLCGWSPSPRFEQVSGLWHGLPTSGGNL